VLKDGFICRIQMKVGHRFGGYYESARAANRAAFLFQIAVQIQHTSYDEWDTESA
jgi:hypothetical protein